MGSVIGIDPGASGGIAYLSAVLRHPLAQKMPETERDTYDLIYSWLWEPVAMADEGVKRPHVTVYLEEVHAMPKQGVSSTWKFGQHYGFLRGVLIALKVPLKTVRPQVWQKTIGCLSRGDKNVTKRRAQELFPEMKITHALADALLIAEYGWREENRNGRWRSPGGQGSGRP